MEKTDWTTWLSDRFSGLRHRDNGHYHIGVPIILWMFDADGRFTLIEGEGLSVLGIPDGELTGKSIYSKNSVVPLAQENVRLALQGERVEDFVEMHDLVWANWYYPIQNEDSSHAGVVCTSFNVTKHWKQVKHQEAVIKLAASLRKSNTRKEMLPVICDSIADILNTDAASLVANSNSGSHLKFEHGNGLWRTSNRDIDHLGDQACLLKATHRIMHSQKPLIRDDWVGMPGNGDNFSLAGIPLTNCNRSIGALWVCRKSPIVDDEVDLLKAFCDLVSRALDREQRQEQTMKHIHQTARERAADKAVDINLALSNLLAQVNSILEIDAARIFLCDTKNRDLKFTAGFGFDDQNHYGERIQYGEGLIGQVALRQRPLLISDMTHPRNTGNLDPRFENEGFMTYYGIPLIVNERLLGVMEIYYRQYIEVKNKWFDTISVVVEKISLAIDGAENYNNFLEFGHDTKRSPGPLQN
ncbi:MAG: GAF domain-containing protein [Anaerolineales bacterium]|nr:GAF domain-containing protein [Chloroflexota bacterium]MBL6980916.1 GAF domain-containing protein [Anaerolineales bacterium]